MYTEENLSKRKVVFSVSTRVVVGIKEIMKMGVRWKLELKLKEDEKLVMGLNRRNWEGGVRGFVV